MCYRFTRKLFFKIMEMSKFPSHKNFQFDVSFQPSLLPFFPLKTCTSKNLLPSNDDFPIRFYFERERNNKRPGTIFIICT